MWSIASQGSDLEQRLDPAKQDKGDDSVGHATFPFVSTPPGTLPTVATAVKP
jgi:hypothetical protein